MIDNNSSFFQMTVLHVYKDCECVLTKTLYSKYGQTQYQHSTAVKFFQFILASFNIKEYWKRRKDIIDICQMSVMTDDGYELHQYGCLQKRLCKCSNLVEKWNWSDHYVRNESKCAPLAYFPLYIFEISFIKWKRATPTLKV